jgi:hypothetical protein
MTQQVIGIGVAPNDGSGDKLRIAYDKCNDNFTDLYALVAALTSAMLTAASVMRSASIVAAAGTVGQVIAFSTQFVAVYALQIIDYNGLGIAVTALDEDGFTITSLSAGDFGYIAFIEV